MDISGFNAFSKICCATGIYFYDCAQDLYDSNGGQGVLNGLKIEGRLTVQPQSITACKNRNFHTGRANIPPN